MEETIIITIEAGMCNSEYTKQEIVDKIAEELKVSFEDNNLLQNISISFE